MFVKEGLAVTLLVRVRLNGQLTARFLVTRYSTLLPHLSETTPAQSPQNKHLRPQIKLINALIFLGTSIVVMAYDSDMPDADAVDEHHRQYGHGLESEEELDAK